MMSIDSAVVLCEAEINDEYVRLPKPNDEYKYAVYIGDLLWASKDGKGFVLALEAISNGKKVPSSLVQFV